MEASILPGGVRAAGRVEVNNDASAELGSIRGAPQAAEPGPRSRVRGTEQLRRRLVTILAHRGCAHPEEVADETMDRVARRLAQVGPDAEIGDPAPFIFGVAWKVTKEWIRRQRTVALPDGWDPADPGEPDILSQERRGTRLPRPLSPLSMLAGQGCHPLVLPA